MLGVSLILAERAVLGHEIGHVTAKHAVSQMSRAQVAQLGLGLGMILSEDVRQIGGLASAGLGLLFLKYGRDDERQADDLGFRYALQEGYDVREMDDVFQTLQRVSAAGGSEGQLPEWLSTHPFPESRIEDTRARLDTLQANLSTTTVGRDAYLKRIDHIVYGPNPRKGYFEGSVFYHPDLKFRMVFPEGWQYQNQAAAVVAVSPERDALVELSFAGEGTPDQAARQFFSQEGVRSGQTSHNPVNGLPAASSSFEAQTADGPVRGVVTFVSHGGITYRILAYTPATRIQEYLNEFLGAVQSFDVVNDPEVLNVKPDRIEIVTLDRAMTLREFSQRYPSTVSLETLAIINGVDLEARFEAGAKVKRVL